MYLCANLLECLRGSLGCEKCRFDPTTKLHHQAHVSAVTFHKNCASFPPLFF